MGAEARIDMSAIGEKAWEDHLTSLADELMAFCSERQGNLGMLRALAQARVIALDLRIVAGLYNTIEPERAQLLLDSAHALLEQGKRAQSGVRFRDGDDDDDTTLPGIPADVFRKYLAAMRR